MELQGAVVLVTGANRGVGSVFVDALLARGASKVYAAARDMTALPLTAAVPVQLDITDPDSVRRAAAQCGDVTVLINNAGVARGGSLLVDDDDAGRSEMEVNYFGTLAMIRAFAPVLGANGGGAIVNVLSVLAWLSMPPVAGYCASKAAEMSLTNSVRVELAAQGTHVLAVHSAVIDTDMGKPMTGPKVSPEFVVGLALDGLVAGDHEVLVDDTTRGVRAALSADLGAIYPEAAATAPVETAPVASSPGVPRLEPGSLEQAGAFVSAAGLVVDAVSSTRFEGHIDVGPDHHTPWGIVHGGVYATAIESAASIAASAAVRDQEMVAVGLTNTTHFLRSITAGRANVVAEALNQGRTQQLWQVDVRDDRGRLLAHGEVRLQNLAAS